MDLNSRLRWFVAIAALFLATGGCGSPSQKTTTANSSAGPDTPIACRHQIAAPDRAPDLAVTGDTVDVGGQTDGRSNAGAIQADGPADSADAEFVPGPATAGLSRLRKSRARFSGREDERT